MDPIVKKLLPYVVATQVALAGVVALATRTAVLARSSVGPQVIEPLAEWHPAAHGAVGSLRSPPLPVGEPGDLAERYCSHLEKIGCPQRATCAGTVRQRQADKLHSMHEDEVLAAKTPDEARATGVVVCWP